MNNNIINPAVLALLVIVGAKAFRHIHESSRVAPAITTVEATSASAANDSSERAALNTVAVEQSAAAVSYIEQPPPAPPPAPAYVPLRAPVGPAVRQIPVYGPRGRVIRYRTVRVR